MFNVIYCDVILKSRFSLINHNKAFTPFMILFAKLNRNLAIDTEVSEQSPLAVSGQVTNIGQPIFLGNIDISDKYGGY